MTDVAEAAFTPKMRDYLHGRGLTDQTIHQFGLTQSGIFRDGPSILIPVEDMVRVYTPNGEPKIKWEDAAGGRDVPPFPSWQGLADADVICEGEFDCMLLRQYQHRAATGTTGASGFTDAWVAKCAETRRSKTLLFDNDPAGRMGMLGGKHPTTGHKVVGLAERLYLAGVPVRIALWPDGKPVGYDVTDFIKEGGSSSDLLHILSTATVYEPDLPPSALYALTEDAKTEEALIGTLLLIGSAEELVTVSALIQPSDIRDERYRAAYQAMLRLNERGEVINFRTVTTELRTASVNYDADLITTLVEVPGRRGAETYAKQIRLLSVRRRLLQVGQRLSSVAAAPGSAAGEDALLGMAQTEYEKLLTHQASGIHIIKPEEYAKTYAEVLLKRETKDPAYIGIPTGYAPLDQVVAYRQGEYWLIAAAPGVGKTTIIKNFQDSLADRGVPSLLASVEQPVVQLWDRSVAADARVDSWRISRGMMSAEEWQKVWRSVGSRAEKPAYIYEDGGMTTATLSAAAHLAKAKFGIRVLFVDYLQLLADEHGDGNEVSRVGYITRRLAGLARRLSITIVAASQLSRAYAKRPKGTLPELTDLRESGQLESDAFVVLGLARNPEDEQQQATLGVLKNRNGEAGLTFHMRFDPEYTRFAFDEEDGGRA